MRTDRLLKLADLLDTVPRERFDMHRWADKNFKPKNCGTAACAGGWATTIFSRQGLRITPTIFGTPQVSFGNLICCDALVAFFGLSTKQSEQLFADFGKSPTPKQKAKEIRKIVREHQREEAKWKPIDCGH